MKKKEWRQILAVEICRVSSFDFFFSGARWDWTSPDNAMETHGIRKGDCFINWIYIGWCSCRLAFFIGLLCLYRVLARMAVTVFASIWLRINGNRCKRQSGMCLPFKSFSEESRVADILQMDQKYLNVPMHYNIMTTYIIIVYNLL